MKRDFVLTVVVGAAAAGLALFAASRTWIVEEALRPEPLPPLGIERSGGSLVPALPAFALVGLAGIGGLLATRGRARMIVSIVVAAAGLGVFLAAFTGFDRYAGAAVWAVVAMLAGLVLAGAGMTALRRAEAWPAMGARYDRPAQAPTAGSGRNEPSQLWDAIDRGQDPTDDTSS